MNIHNLSAATAEHLLRVVHNVPLNENRHVPIERISADSDTDFTVFGDSVGCDCSDCLSQRQTSRRTALDTIASGDWRRHLRTALARTRSVDKRIELERLYAALDTGVPTEVQWIPDALTELDIDAITATVTEAPVTLEQMRARQFEERAIAVIPDDECTDMGSYLIWNKYTPDVSIYLGAPDQVYRSYDTIAQRREDYGYGRPGYGEDPRFAEKIHANLTKPVRAKGFYKYVTPDGDDVYVMAWIDESMQQRLLLCREDGTADRSVPTARTRLYRGAVPLPLHKWPEVSRRSCRGRLFENLYNRGVIDRARYMSAVGVRPAAGLTIRSVAVHPQAYTKARAMMQLLGRMAANTEDRNVDKFIDFLQMFHVQFQAIAVRLTYVFSTAWNRGLTEDDAAHISFGACGHWHPTHEGMAVGHDESERVCQSCFDDNYVMCEDVNAYFHRDNAHYNAEDDVYSYRDPDESRESDARSTVGGAIQDYSTNVLRSLSPDLSFTPSQHGDTWMGVELEVVPKPGARVETVTDTIKNLTRGYAIMKRDGSLSSGGYEIVTAPRSLAEHIRRFSEWTPHRKLRAWDAGCCGMHVHLSSQAFSQATLGKFIEFINAKENDKLIIAIAGRHATLDSQSAQYCQREGVAVVGNPKQSVRYKDSARYRMVNALNLSRAEAIRLGVSPDYCNGKNYDTIELRIFRASLNKARLLAQIEFAHAALMFCRVTSFRELRQEHFLSWLQKSAGMYKNLAKWFGVRGNTSVIEETPKVRATAEV